MGDPPSAAVWKPFAGTFSARSSVEPELVDALSVVGLTELERTVTTFPDGDALTPIACKLVSALIADASPVAILVEPTV